MKLPIDLIPNTDPPQFRWVRTLDTLNGEMEARHEGSVPPHLEGALVALVEVAHKLERDNEGLYAQLLKCQERVAELSKQAIPPTIKTTSTSVSGNTPNEPAQQQRPRPDKRK